MTAPQILHYRDYVGRGVVALRVAAAELLPIIARFYPAYREHSPEPRETGGAQICLDRENGSYKLAGPSGDWYADEEAAALCESELTDALLADASRYVYLHAAAVCGGDTCLVLVGGSGTGKSVLSFGLLLHGLQPLSDDVVLVDPSAGHIEPFLRSIRVHRKALLRLGLGDELPEGAQLCEPYLWVHPDVAARGRSKPHAIRAFVFLEHGRRTQLERLRASRSLERLMLGRFGGVEAAREFECLSRLAAQVPGYRLTVRRFPEALAELQRAFSVGELACGPRLGREGAQLR